MKCNVRTNTISHMKTKGFIDENSIVRDALFYQENARLSNLAREKYHVMNRKSLFFTHSLDNNTVKATPNEDMFRELQDRKDNPDDYTGTITQKLTEEEMALLTETPEEAVGPGKVSTKSNLNESGDIYITTIRRNRRDVGEVKSINDGTYLTETRADVYQPGEGIGYEAYLQIGEEANKMGLTFRSDKIDTRLSPAAIGLWEKLARNGKALRIGNHYYYGEIAKADNLPSILPKC